MRGRSRRLVAAAVLALAVAGAWMALGAGDGPGNPDGWGIAQGTAPIGFNDIATQDGRVNARTVAALAARVGARTVRFTLNWGEIERERGNRRWGMADAQYRQALAHGQRPILMVLDSPAWARAARVDCPRRQICTYPPAPEHVSDFAAFAAATAARYPEALALEVWNEPNLHGFWSPQPDARAYGGLLRAVHKAVKASRPELPVLGGSIANSPGDSPVAMDSGTYLKALLGHAGAAMDGLAIHPYPFTATPGATYRLVTQARDLMASAGLSLPLWITEVGATTTGPQGLSPATQARSVDRVVRYLRRQPDVRAIVIHTLADRPKAPADNPERGYGLLGVDLAPKLAWCVLARAAGGPDPCAAAPSVTNDEAADERAQDALQSAVDAALRHRSENGDYRGLDARLSRPAEVVVGRGGRRVMLCAASTSRRSYCAFSSAPGQWRYGYARGSVEEAAGRTLGGPAATW